MTTFNSNEEFFNALRDLIYRWCDERRLQPLSRLLPGYLAFNGLTDGWGQLLAGLVLARSIGADRFTESDWAILSDLISAAGQAIHRG